MTDHTYPQEPEADWDDEAIAVYDPSFDPEGLGADYYRANGAGWDNA
jgi:hypothetical protein